MWCLAARDPATVAHIPCRLHRSDADMECLGTPEVERMRCKSAAHPPPVQVQPSASAGVVLRQIVKEHPPRCGGAIHRSLARTRVRTVGFKGVEKRKRPGTLWIPGLRVQRMKGALLVRVLSRMQMFLVAIKP